MFGVRFVRTDAFGAEPGETLEGELWREILSCVERDELWPLGLGRTEGGAPGRAAGVVLGRTPELDPREGLGLVDGREKPPLEGRGAALEPREPWLEEGREAEPPLEPRDDEADAPEDPFEPRWVSAREGLAAPIQSRNRPTKKELRVFICAPMVWLGLRVHAKEMPAGRAPLRPFQAAARPPGKTPQKRASLC